jgi:hypothetical protein
MSDMTRSRDNPSKVIIYKRRPIKNKQKKIKIKTDKKIKK